MAPPGGPPFHAFGAGTRTLKTHNAMASPDGGVFKSAALARDRLAAEAALRREAERALDRA